MSLTIALVTGGYSKEREISYLSAENVYKELNKTLYSVYWVDLSRKEWVVKTPQGNYPINVADFSFENEHKDKINFDVAFICIHGTPGEDGKLQGYFELIGLPYTTCDVTTSALTFNKRFTVAVASMAGIKTARSLHVIKTETFKTDEILSQLKLPLFVKPNNGGSSFGISMIESPDQLEAAIEKAFIEDDQIIIEEGIVGRELTIGVYGSKDALITLPAIEIVSKNKYFDYNAKYKGESSEICPAQIDDQLKLYLEQTAKKIYRALLLRGICRMDFIYETSSKLLYFLEVNTVPGLTNESLVPKELKAAGIEPVEFYKFLINSALEHGSNT